MKIGPSDSKPLAAPTVGERNTEASHGPAKAGTPVEASTEVALSTTATELAKSDAEGSFDAEKVARISKAIEDGTFKINPEAIADKLISNAQEVLGKVSQS